MEERKPSVFDHLTVWNTCTGRYMASKIRAFWNSPVGPKTTHFWGPIANWGFVIAVCLCTLFKRFYVSVSGNQNLTCMFASYT